jgi:hypothetical protein
MNISRMRSSSIHRCWSRLASWNNNIGADLESQIDERLKENILRKMMSYCRFICAFRNPNPPRSRAAGPISAQGSGGNRSLA